ncbi:RICIN domain-containing protein [Streptomyces ehimensis]|uniref:RICIN domain-containing protein n=1 Tax=Streptomyces ehimensis TaxID=68195 RepID=A0ABV9BWY1_9ACTN
MSEHQIQTGSEPGMNTLSKITSLAATPLAVIVLLAPTTSQAASPATERDGAWLTNYKSNKCLEVEGSSSKDGARVQQWDCKGQAGANWVLGPGGDGNGYVQISNSKGCPVNDLGVGAGSVGRRVAFSPIRRG